MMNEVREFLSKLEGRVLVLTHHNADVDAMASALALKEFLSGKCEARVGVSESVSRLASQVFSPEVLVNPDCSEFDAVILVDTSVPEQLKGVENLRADAVIDHHPPGKLVGRVSFVDESAKSTSQLVYLLLRSFGPVDPKIQEILATGIVTDTAHLRLADREVFRILSEMDVDFQRIFKKLETEPDISERVATLKAARRMEIFKFGEILVVFSFLGSHEAVACRNLVKLGADIAVVITKKENEMRISSRAREKVLKKGIDLSEIFREVGRFLEGSGGGHNLAGSANGKVKNPVKVKGLILSLLSERLGRYRKLR